MKSPEQGFNPENQDSKEQVLQSVLTRLSDLMSDESIKDDSFTGIRQSLGSVYTILNNEFDPNSDNKEVVEKALNKLMILTDSNPELNEREFETFRTALGTIITKVNNELS